MYELLNVFKIKISLLLNFFYNLLGFNKSYLVILNKLIILLENKFLFFCDYFLIVFYYELFLIDILIINYI